MKVENIFFFCEMYSFEFIFAQCCRTLSFFLFKILYRSTTILTGSTLDSTFFRPMELQCLMILLLNHHLVGKPTTSLRTQGLLANSLHTLGQSKFSSIIKLNKHERFLQNE